MENAKGRGLRIGYPELLIVAQSVIYGFGDPISKIVFDTTPVYTAVSVRYLIAFAVSFVIFRKRVIVTLRTVPVRAWLMPGLFIGLTYLLNNVALSLTDATSVAFLRSLSVILTPLFSYIIYRHKYKALLIGIQIMVLPGMYLLCIKGGLSGFGAGEIVTVIAASMMACALVSSRKYLGQVEPASMTVLMAGCSFALAAAGCIALEGGPQLQNTTQTGWLIILYLAVACTLLGYLMQNLALTKISDRAVALLQSLCPVMTAIFSYFILGEKLSLAGIAGALIIIACVAAATILFDDRAQ